MRRHTTNEHLFTRRDVVDIAVVLLIVLWFIMFVVVFKANADDSRTVARDRCTLLARDVLPTGWTIITVNEPTWRKLKRRYMLPPDAQTAFTSINDGWTVVRERYALTATNEILRHTLAHEGGHVACRCASEDVANLWAWEHEGLSWGIIQPGETRNLVNEKLKQK